MQVSHSVVPTVESEPVYVIWDEFAIVRDLLNTLHASTTSDTKYIRDQTDLVSCMNDNRASTSTPTYTSFSDILSRYAGDTKTTIEDHCSATSTKMFSTNKTVSRSKLAGLKSGSSSTSTMYAALLESPSGTDFEAELADPDILKLVSYLGANVAGPGSLQQPVYRSSGASGQSDTLPPGVTLEQSAGLGCLPTGIDQDRLTLNNKLRVLNCLVFATPHSFWVQGTGTRVADTLRRQITNSSSRFAWLDSGDWKCSDPPIGRTPQGPVPSCLKHDVAYGSLQKFDGERADDPVTAAPDGEELDRTWNPRNKALADYKYKADITRWGCQDQSGNDAAALCKLPNELIAEWPYFRAVARHNNKGWPVTNHDVADFTARPAFVNCPEPVVPSFTDLAATRSGRSITLTGTYAPGCASVPLRDVWFGIDRRLSFDIAMTPKKLDPVTECRTTGNDFVCTFTNSVPATSIKSISVYVIPRDKEYGGSNYGRDDKRGRGVTIKF